MTKTLNGAGFVIQTDKIPGTDRNSPQDNTPNSTYAVHAGEQNTRQGVTLHPKDDCGGDCNG
jgi:hypothetical protein